MPSFLCHVLFGYLPRHYMPTKRNLQSIIIASYNKLVMGQLFSFGNTIFSLNPSSTSCPFYSKKTLFQSDNLCVIFVFSLSFMLSFFSYFFFFWCDEGSKSLLTRLVLMMVSIRRPFHLRSEIELFDSIETVDHKHAEGSCVGRPGREWS